MSPGPTGDTYLDFRPNSELEGKHFIDFLGLGSYQQDNEPFYNPCGLEPNENLWEPEGALYYAGELTLQPQERWTRSQQLELLDTHPMWTGRCPACYRQFHRYDTPPVYWDCGCGWMNDTV